ncbi:MAG: bifunctional indole-3-glycerol-phosphate synthase TrpC/phosphoribosylanthranilate isomerase TrpF [archaeon]|jgi:indole-3-glycerol phosphate synthase/phosphoribosylanthranilate isomerase
MTILDEIVANKKIEIIEAKKKLPLEQLQKNLAKSNSDFLSALKGKNNIICELKFNAPSSGKTKSTKSLGEIIELYDTYASAISVLTDQKYFSGNLEYIKEAKKHTKLPILRKDFIIDPYQIYEARYYGADAILLIASLLSKEEINNFLKIANELGMDALVEVREEDELTKVLGTNAKIIGINNRNLKTFTLNLDQTKILKEKIPSDKIVVSESGIYTKEEILDLDTNAVLIGTSLMNASDMQKTLCDLHKTKLKICGITNLEDAQMCVKQNVDLLGFNFYKNSKRYITPEIASEIILQLPNTVQSVGVFVNATQEEIETIVNKTGIDFIQLHGDENQDFVNKLSQKFEDKVIKVFKIKNKVESFDTLTYAKMFDTFTPEFGGSGKEFDLKVISKEKGKIFIAGGINVNNVKKVLELKPYCIDVCSGSEIEPGKKDENKVTELVEMIK